MNILVISKQGGYSGLAHRIALEGHNVAFYAQDRDWSEAGVGYYSNIDSWRPVFAQASLILCDEDLPFPVISVLESRGVPVLNCSTALEFSTMNQDVKDGISRLLNPEIEAATQATLTTNETLPISVLGFWTGIKWIKPYFVAFREDRPYHPKFSIKTKNAVGAVVVPKPVNKLFDNSLRRIEEVLRATNYRGSVQIDGFVNTKTVLWSYLRVPAEGLVLETAHSMMRMYIADFLQKLGSGTLDEIPLKRENFSIGVLVTQAPWPYPLNGKSFPPASVLFSKEQIKHCYIHNMKANGASMDDGAAYVGTTNKARDLMTVVAPGNSPRQARHRVYRTIDNLFKDEVQLRTDIGVRVVRPYRIMIDFLFRPHTEMVREMEGDLSALTKWGWI
jgi:hypothetical protein